jgi:hypothetical protein
MAHEGEISLAEAVAGGPIRGSWPALVKLVPRFLEGEELETRLAGMAASRSRAPWTSCCL